MYLNIFRTGIFLLLLFSLASASAGQEVITTLADQQEVAVTIYNSDLALVKDRRSITLPPGEHSLAFRGVSAMMQPETVLCKGRSFKVIEQNFEYDLLTPEALLRKFVGKEVSLVKVHPTTGVEHQVKARVLSAQGGVVLQVEDRIETGVPGRLVFPDVPANLRDKPTLTMLVSSNDTSPRDVELSYLTGGLHWQADYVAELSASDDSLNLNGWVTLTNESGTSYNNARLQLVAGDVHRVRQPENRGNIRMMKAASVEATMDQNMSEEAMFEYHLYTLERPTTIRDQQRKQVALLKGTDIPCRKEFVLKGRDYYYRSRFGEIGSRIKVGVFVEIKNEKEHNLGIPLPAGTMRVYKKDSSGSLQFVGEDRVDHTPENEIIRLKLGDAFDITADKKQTDFKKLGGFTRYNYVSESAYEIIVKNAKSEAVIVKVLEPVPGDWEIIEESDSHKKETSSTASWHLKVPAKGEKTLTYRVQVKY